VPAAIRRGACEIAIDCKMARRGADRVFLIHAQSLRG
jgi:hypothetical protein